MHVEQAINFQGRQSTICIFHSRFGKFFFWYGAGGNTPNPGLVPCAHPGQRGVVIAGIQCILQTSPDYFKKTLGYFANIGKEKTIGR